MPAQWTILMLTGTVVALVLAFALAVAAWDGRRDGLQCWAGALGLQALTCAILAPSGPFASLWVTVGSGLAGAASVACVQAAIARLHGQALPWPVLVAPVGALALGLLTLGRSTGPAAVLIGSVVAGQIAWVLWTLLEQRMRLHPRGAMLVALGLGGLMALHAALAAAGLVGLPDPHALLGEPMVLGAGALWALAAWLLATQGFVFVHGHLHQMRGKAQAALDETTGIANRRSIIAALDRDVARAIRTRLPMAVLMLELELSGPGAPLAPGQGDALMCSLVDLVQNRIRSQDIVGRYGPRELLVVLPDTAQAGALRLAGQLCSVAHTLRAVQGASVPAASLSVGVFGGRLEPGDSWDQLIHAADQALGVARQRGGNRVEAAAPLQRVPRGGLHTPVQETSPTTLG